MATGTAVALAVAAGDRSECRGGGGAGSLGARIWPDLALGGIHWRKHCRTGGFHLLSLEIFFLYYLLKWLIQLVTLWNETEALRSDMLVWVGKLQIDW